ncbi:MAG: VWA-like domain-containing protein [Lachnospiraceae bacterium]|nr:VWA-like domain-containing protein [Lachnospiraceae bacterium]
MTNIDSSFSDSENALSRFQNPALEILRILQEQSMVRFSAFPEAFGYLKPISTDEISLPLGTDGQYLYYEPELLCRSYLNSPEYLFRIWLHVHLHCLLLHVSGPHTWKTPESRTLYQKACDLSAALLMTLLLPDESDQLFLRLLNQCLDNHAEGRPPVPTESLIDFQNLLSLLPDNFRLQELADRCVLDSHQFWPDASPVDSVDASAKASAECGNSSAGSGHPALSPQLLRQWTCSLAKLWTTLSNRSETRGLSSASAVENAVLQEHDGMDYHQFLRRFTVPGEEALLDLESFDYIPYHYGFTHYGNLAFLEPLEYREVNRLDELAIAIDTSGSCSGRIVRRFLEETWNILRQRENFFARMRLHLIQCDSMIQEHRIFTSLEEWEDALPNLKIRGHGNTDFRPVFQLLNKMIEKREIRRLRGLLYFTDGDGIYPGQAPPYDTAFVFLNRQTEKQKIPNWAIRLNLNLNESFK